MHVASDKHSTANRKDNMQDMNINGDQIDTINNQEDSKAKMQACDAA